MPAKRKLTRKELLKQPDEFITISSKIGTFVREQGRTVVFGLGATLSVLILTGVFYLYQQHNLEQANLLETAAYKAYHGQVIGATENLSPQGTIFSSKEELYKTAQSKYQELLNKYPDTPHGKRARLYIGLCAYQLGEYEQAKQAYQQLLDESSQEDSWYQQTLHNLGYAQEGAGEYLQAAQTYQQLVNLVSDLSKPMIYLDLGRAYEQAKAWEQAQQTYESMLKLATTPEQQKMIQGKLRQIQAKSKADVS